MQTFIAWCTFFGAWLLLAGPIYQAVIELGELDIEEERLNSARAKLVKPEPVSGWWWLVPPVKLTLEKRRHQAFRQAYFDALEPEDFETFVLFVSKSTGWFFVAAGGFLLALSETYVLTERMHWHHWITWPIALVMLGLAIGNTIILVRRNKQTLATKQR